MWKYGRWRDGRSRLWMDEILVGVTDAIFEYIRKWK